MEVLQDSALEQSNKLHYCPERSDSFVIDMDGFMVQGSSPANKDIPISIPTFALQRSLSRKGSQRFSGRERNVNADNLPGGGESAVPTPSPKGCAGASLHEKGTAMAATGVMEQHPIPSSAGNLYSSAEGRYTTRKNISLKRYSAAWGVDPKSVLLFFATLSSIGTMLLIYFTLSMNKISILDNVPE